MVAQSSYGSAVFETAFERDRRDPSNSRFRGQLVIAFSALLVGMSAVFGLLLAAKNGNDDGQQGAAIDDAVTTVVGGASSSPLLLRTESSKFSSSAGGGPQLPLLAEGAAEALLAGGGTSVCWTDKDMQEVSCVSPDEGISVFASGLTNPRDVKLDATGKSLLFTDMDDGLIAAVSTAIPTVPTEQHLLYDGLEEPQLMVISNDDYQVYWTDEDAGVIRRAATDGSTDAVEDLVAVTPGVLVTIALSECGTYLYWCDYDESTISRARVDGDFSDAEVVVDGLNGPKYMDIVGDAIYFCDDACTSIKSIAVEGVGDATTHVADLGMSIKALAVDAAAEYVYFTDGTDFKISRMSLSTGAFEDIVTDLGSPMGLEIIEQ